MLFEVHDVMAFYTTRVQEALPSPAYALPSNYRVPQYQRCSRPACQRASQAARRMASQGGHGPHTRHGLSNSTLESEELRL